MIYRSAVTVIEAADSYDLATIEAVKAYFNVPIVTDDPGDARLQLLITLQSKAIADYCDRVFALEKVSEVIYTNVMGVAGDFPVPLSRWPVVEIDSVMRDTVGLNDYTVDADSGVLFGSLSADELTVTYTAGYELPFNAPGPLSLAVIDMVRQSFFYGSRDPMVQSMTDNSAGSIRFFPPPGISKGGGGSKGSPLSSTATALVAPYRRPGMA